MIYNVQIEIIAKKLDLYYYVFSVMLEMGMIVMNDHKIPKNYLFLIFVFIIFIVLIVVMMRYLNFSNVKKVNGQNYNGYIVYDTSKKLNGISYTLPNNFIDSSSKTAISAKYEAYDDKGFSILCKLNVAVVANYKGTEDLAKGMAKYNKTSYNLVTINNIDWYNLNYVSTLNYNIYLTTYKKKILMYEYSGTDSCLKFNNEIINSIFLN